MSSKKALGQFMTKRYAYILQDMEIPKGVSNIIEPFAGAGDLLGFLPKNRNFTVEAYDIAPSYPNVASVETPNVASVETPNVASVRPKITRRDTLGNPPSFSSKFLITNPPYLARNKATDKIIFDLYQENDLYKCFLRIIIGDPPCGGIIIIPLNFWSSIRPRDIALRRDFLRVFEVVRVNVFEEQVFDDTSYSVCAIQFVAWEVASAMTPRVPMRFFPSKDTLEVALGASNNWTIGGEIYKLGTDGFNLWKYPTRLTKKNANGVGATNLLVKCIDDNKGNPIKMTFVDDKEIYIDRTKNLSARSYMSLSIEPPLTEAQQRRLAQDFNEWLADARQRYRSLFLTNYRESADAPRKRISFELVYRIVAHLLARASSKKEEED